jgi:precorrin-2 dehydrogenase / sirohydrochlorin ferrochelatase
MVQSTMPEQAERNATPGCAESERNSPALFPMFLKLAGRACLVVGAGSVGTPKIEGLLAAGADVTVVAPDATEAVQVWANAGRLLWHARTFELSDLDGAFLVVAATSSNPLNDAVFKEAQRRGVLANVVDDPPRCDFYYPAVVRRGALQIAVSTDGKSPALAQRLRKQFEREFGPVYEDWVEELGRERQRLFARPMDADERRQMLHALASQSSFEAYLRGRSSAGEPERIGGNGQ